MRVSIIVPTLNEEAHIEGTIRSLQQLSGEKETIMVDRGSTDQTFRLSSAQNELVLKAPQGRGHRCHRAPTLNSNEIINLLVSQAYLVFLGQSNEDFYQQWGNAGC